MQIYGKLAIGAAFVMVLTTASNAFAIPSGPNQNYGGNSNSSWGSSEDKSGNSKYKTPSGSGEFPKDDKGLFSKDYPKYPGAFDDADKKKYSQHDYDDKDKEKYKDKDKDKEEYDDKEHHHKGDYKNVPEPTSVLLLGAGLAGLGIWRRKVS